VKAVSATRIFTGIEWLSDHAVVVNDGVIDSIVPIDQAGSIAERIHYKGLLVPAFIDIQIYGAMGSLLAVEPTASTLSKMNKYCRNGGAAYFLPTVATNTLEVMEDCIEAVRSYWQQGGEGVVGLHIEGPWINPMKRGAHIESLIHAPSVSEVTALLEKGKGVIKMITLAPEVCTEEVISSIQSYGVVVSAGHSNATYEEATKAFDKGITVATHLFNAMSPLQHRTPGMVGAILNHSSVRASIIPDGYHVDFAAVAIAKKVMRERLFMITDAVTETNKGMYPHQLVGDKYESKGILSGSALTMIKGVKNGVEHIGIELDEALRMASLYPAEVLGLQQKLGRIQRGFEAAFTFLDDQLNVVSL
jgi:N-acetylglucosamine-6-phosphate deacetylase